MLRAGPLCVRRHPCSSAAGSGAARSRGSVVLATLNQTGGIDILYLIFEIQFKGAPDFIQELIPPRYQ